MVSLWNSLPQEIVDAKTLNAFKRRLDIALGANGIKGYGMISHDLFVPPEQGREERFASTAKEGETVIILLFRGFSSVRVFRSLGSF